MKDYDMRVWEEKLNKREIGISLNEQLMGDD